MVSPAARARTSATASNRAQRSASASVGGGATASGRRRVSSGTRRARVGALGGDVGLELGGGGGGHVVAQGLGEGLVGQGQLLVAAPVEDPGAAGVGGPGHGGHQGGLARPRLPADQHPLAALHPGPLQGGLQGLDLGVPADQEGPRHRGQGGGQGQGGGSGGLGGGGLVAQQAQVGGLGGRGGVDAQLLDQRLPAAR